MHLQQHVGTIPKAAMLSKWLIKHIYIVYASMVNA